MLLVRFQVLGPALVDELDHPARIEVDAEADASSVLGEVLDGQAQAPGTRRAEHQPVGPPGEVLLGKVVAEELVVGAEVVYRDAALGDSSCSTGLEDVDGLVGEGLGHPAADRPAPQPRIFEEGELPQILKTLDVFARIEVQLFLKLQPERRAALGIEVPLHDLPDVGIECLPGLLRPLLQLFGDVRFTQRARSIFAVAPTDNPTGEGFERPRVGARALNGDEAAQISWVQSHDRATIVAFLSREWLSGATMLLRVTMSRFKT